jgi:hypothetical protein
MTGGRSGIARQQSEIDGYYSGWSTGKEGIEGGNKDRIKEMSDQDDEQAVDPGDSSVEEEEKSERRKRETRV